MSKEEEVQTVETSTETVGANIDEGIPPEIIRPDHAIKKGEALGGFDLNPKTVEELKGRGVFMDGLSPLKGKKKDTDKDKEDKSESGKSKKADESEASQKEQPEKSEEAEDKDKGGENKEKEPTFIDKVTEKLGVLTDEEQEQFLSDLESAGFKNWTGYTKSNTQKAQKLSEREKSLGDIEVAHAFAKFLDSEKVLNLLDIAQKNKDVIENVLSQLDDGFFSDETNPEANILRQIYSLFTASAEPAQVYTKKQQEISEKENELMLDEEIIALKRETPEYVDDEKLKELIQFAVDQDVNLMQAHKIKSAESGNEELAKSKKEVKALNDELIKVKEEFENLKKKTPNYTKKKVTEEKEDETNEPQTMGTRAMEIATMDDTERGVRKKLGLD